MLKDLSTRKNIIFLNTIAKTHEQKVFIFQFYITCVNVIEIGSYTNKTFPQKLS